MNCEPYQDRILDYEQLTAAEQQSVDAHLRVCPHCRELGRQWRALDAALANQLRAPDTPEGFETQVRQRIAGEMRAATDADLAERRRMWEARYATSHRCQSPWRWIPRVLDVLGFGVAGGLGGWVVLRLLTLASAAWSAAPALTATQALVISAATGIVIALGLAALVFNRTLRRVWLR
jgi:anti-sigma factor RsiW